MLVFPKIRKFMMNGLEAFKIISITENRIPSEMNLMRKFFRFHTKLRRLGIHNVISHPNRPIFFQLLKKMKQVECLNLTSPNQEPGVPDYYPPILHCINFNFINNRSIPMVSSFEFLWNLKSLELEFYVFKGIGVLFGKCFKHAYNLRELTMIYKEMKEQSTLILTDFEKDSIIKSVILLKNLSKFSLVVCNSDPGFMIKVLGDIEKMSQLTSFTLNLAYFKGTLEKNTISTYLPKLYNLKELCIYLPGYRFLDEEVAGSYIEAILWLNNLRKLSLNSGLFFSDEVAAQIQSLFVQLKNLEELDLNFPFKRFTNKTLSYFLTGLGYQYKLKFLKLDFRMTPIDSNTLNEILKAIKLNKTIVAAEIYLAPLQIDKSKINISRYFPKLNIIITN